MYHNPDWDMAAKRLAAFWHKEIIDRPCIQMYVDVPAQTLTADQEEAVTPEQSWIDPQTFLQVQRRHIARTAYLGEALPVLYPNAEHVARAMGSGLTYSSETIWIHKTPGGVGDLDFSLVTLEQPAIREMTDYFARLADAAQGECFVGFPHMGNAGDTLARMRGYENLCLDLYDDPQRCFELEDQILRIWKMSYDVLHAVITQRMPGSCGWLPAWHPGRCALIEFDFCALISPVFFQRYVPYLVERARHTEHAIYHLDGPDALAHLDDLLNIGEIGFIQWEPGAGSGDILQWLPLMQKIQAAGKGLYISGGPHNVEKAKVLLRELQPEGLMIPVHAADIDEAQWFLDSLVISAHRA